MSELDWPAVLLELLNTTPVVDGRMIDLLDQAWLRAHRATGDLDDVQRLRNDLQRVVRGDIDASVLRRYLVDVRQKPEIGETGVEWMLEADWPAHLVLAWGELHAEMPGRLRPCANDECRLFLIDRSRSGTARWCSMSGCGNRMKARRYYRRAQH
ncbi:CGNR zinc finger domain-containing protein [Mycobacterium sp.]|uniref:CGNR zinc finger domain-containing protein n=1 Tax=Mycobacterium sp. TaxID=1785 RepID=UPI002D8B2BD7|nr:CGNR zinc finger domain-containing protein [Mycobacterium sp.]